MKNVSGPEGHEQGGSRETKPLFPSEGHFSPVIPLSRSAREAARAADEDETTLVTARPGRAPRPAYTSTAHAKQGAEHSWAFLAFAIALSALAGAAAGIYILRSQRPAEAFHAGPPAVEAATAGQPAGQAQGTEPDAEPPAPQASAPDPQPEQPAELAARPESPVPPVAPAQPRDADAKVERAETPARLQREAPQPAEPPARRAAQPEPRAASPARPAPDAREASPAPRLTRAAAAPRRAERDAPARINPPERPPLISAPPPSAKSKRVIQWP